MCSPLGAGAAPAAAKPPPPGAAAAPAAAPAAAAARRAAAAVRSRAAIADALRREQRAPTYRGGGGGAGGAGVLGCRHYERGCKLYAECCGVYVTCRLCHDEAFEGDDGHVLDRHAVGEVLCMRCGEEQPVAAACVKCAARFAAYFCGECRLYTSDEPAVYHCDKCKLCRKGRREDNVHCDGCDACVGARHAASHACREQSMKGDCPVCVRPLFTSTEPCVYLPCGHSMHGCCLNELSRRDYRCCLCLRALGDMSAYYRAVDRALAGEEALPPHLAARRATIFCNDCSRRSVVPWHYEYHRCPSAAAGGGGGVCGSYNTSVLAVTADGGDVGG